MTGLGPFAEAVWAGRTPAARLVSSALAPLGWTYAAAVAARNRLYDAGSLGVERVPARVVSVGNVAVGGSGKTPTALWLAERLAATGRRVAIVARGYGKRRRGVVVVGRDGEPLVSAAEGGDEAVLMARRYRGAVVVGEDRVAAARAACTAAGAEIVVLDDGFQHRRLGRDADLVLLGFDPRRELLPAGPMREPPAALRRASAVVVVDDEGSWPAEVVPAGVPVFRARTVPTALIEVVDGAWREHALATLAGRDVTVAAGIARPERLARTVEFLGARVVERVSYGDHHAYTARDLERFRTLAARTLVVTTEKDLTKLVELAGTPPVQALRIGVAVDDAEALVRLAAGEDVVCGNPIDRR
jgi:tetraacyldisaccharide 4'-kinase